jgi:hypothetical protein
MDIAEICHSTNYWVEVDKWTPLLEDRIFNETKNAIILPVSKFYGLKEDSILLDNFILIPKRCYNSDEVRGHIVKYLNYFERFYDIEHELLFYIYRIKILIDMGIDYKDVNGNKVHAEYSLENFLNDIKTYILSDSIYKKTWKMVEDNYSLELNYKNKANEALQYCDRHGKYLMEISIFQNILIPLLMHFVYKNKLSTSTNTVNKIIFTVYNWLFDVYKDYNVMAKRGLQPADIFQKLYETAITTMNAHYKTNKILWEMSSIRGFCPTINANDAIDIVIMQVIPKYTFKGNVISYNISSIRNNIKYNISDIGFEYDFVSLSSSKRDGEDNTSQFDKFEAHLQKTDEGLALQNDFRAEVIMDKITKLEGGVSKKEIDFYRKALIKNGQFLVNKFQQNLVNNIFYKYFGDTVSINSINADDYITLIVIGKRILLRSGMKLLPYIVSSAVVKISTRTGVCKKELMKIEQSEYYSALKRKYNGNEKIMKQIFSLIATTLSSSFKIIDYDEDNEKAGKYNGKDVVMENDIIIDEMIRFIIAI